jgi:hypothetical protein
MDRALRTTLAFEHSCSSARRRSSAPGTYYRIAYTIHYWRSESAQLVDCANQNSLKLTTTGSRPAAVFLNPPGRTDPGHQIYEIRPVLQWHKP